MGTALRAHASCAGLVLTERWNNGGSNPPFVPRPIPLQLRRELLCFPWEMLPSLHSVPAWRGLWGSRGTAGPSGVAASGGRSTIIVRDLGACGSAGGRQWENRSVAQHPCWVLHTPYTSNPYSASFGPCFEEPLALKMRR